MSSAGFRNARSYEPIKLLDLELAAPVQPLRDCGAYSKARLLVRVASVPVGYVDLPLRDGACSAERLVDRALAAHLPAVQRQLVRHALDRGCPQHEWDQQDALPRIARPLLHPPLVSVAVCTRDRTDGLARCLGSLSALDYPRLELLVIDNAPSSESTAELVRRRFPRVRYVREQRPGLDWARNRAIVEAQGEILAFTDDDVLVDPDWARRLVELFQEDPAIGAVTGLVVPAELETEAQFAYEDHRGYHGGFARTWNRVEAGRSAARPYGAAGELGTGANMAFRREVFTRVGGFDYALDVGTPTRGGGDLEMFFRLIKEGYTLVREPRAVVRHCHRRSYDQLRAQLATWGLGMFAYIARSWQMYPDERPGLSWLLARWLILRNARRFGSSLWQRELRPELVWAEMRSSLLAPFRYRQARRRVTELQELCGPAPIPDRVPAIRRARQVRRGAEVRDVDLSAAPVAIEGLGPARELLVRVYLRGASVGTVRIDQPPKRVCVAELRDVIAEQLSEPLRAHLRLDEAAVRSLCTGRRMETSSV
jgi:O-antigen biosynthesis protein